MFYKESCQQIADKYLEYDPVNIIIDLVLLNEQAYRHILYNYNFQIDTHSQLDLFDRERSFYWTCLQTIIGSTMLFLIVCAITKVYRPPHDCHYATLWKALVLASFCKFLLVPGLIWGDMGPVTHHYFVTGYTLLSQLKAHSGDRSTHVPSGSGCWVYKNSASFLMTPGACFVEMTLAWAAFAARRKEGLASYCGEPGRKEGSVSYCSEPSRKEGLVSYRGELGRKEGSASYHGELGRKEGSTSYCGELGRKEGSASYRGEPGRKEGSASYLGETGRKEGLVNYLGETGRKEGSASYHGEPSSNEGLVSYCGESVVTHSSRLMSGLVVSLGLVGKVASMQLLSQL
uniref:Protein ARV n=1 Tax=Timema shepardi TaxID=629360 RepID=A0A7R9B0S9_TIMSH|nr:unnamed protein product [Timema shepardi]